MTGTLFNNTENVDLSTLKIRAHRALTRAVTHQIEATIGSTWSPDGFGWQELWEDSGNAGVYASCDGLTLLHKAAPFIPSIDLQYAFRHVYDKHLLPIFDVSTPAHGTPNQHMRSEARTITMKLAKFLVTSLLHPDLPANAAPVIEWAKSELLRVARGHQGFLPPTTAPHALPALYATIEAYAAIRGSERERSSFSLRRSLLKSLRSVAASSLSTPMDRVAALWGLAGMPGHLRGKTKTAIGHMLDDELQRYGDALGPETWRRATFHNNATRRNDYYTYSAPLVLATAALTLRGHSIPLSADTAKVIHALVSHVVSALDAYPKYRPTPSVKVQFWEHAQAVSLLIAYLTNGASLPRIQGDILMYINPTIFVKKTFKTDPQLGVVIMPFRPKWSDDVFETFRLALQKENMEAWRSDLTYKDDTIVQTIWEQINASSFVIADCTGRNPNVFYELGIAHTIGKPVFLCAQKRTDFPFDIAAVRSHVYDPLPRDLRNLRLTIRRFIHNL